MLRETVQIPSILPPECTTGNNPRCIPAADGGTGFSALQCPFGKSVSHCALLTGLGQPGLEDGAHQGGFHFHQDAERHKDQPRCQMAQPQADHRQKQHHHRLGEMPDGQGEGADQGVAQGIVKFCQQGEGELGDKGPDQKQRGKEHHKEGVDSAACFVGQTDIHSQEQTHQGQQKPRPGIAAEVPTEGTEEILGNIGLLTPDQSHGRIEKGAGCRADGKNRQAAHQPKHIEQRHVKQTLHSGPQWVGVSEKTLKHRFTPITVIRRKSSGSLRADYSRIRFQIQEIS